MTASRSGIWTPSLSWRVRGSRPRTPTAGDPQHFDLSCGHHDQNIVRITARAQRSPGTHTAAMVSLTLALDTGELLSVETPGAAARSSTALL